MGNNARREWRTLFTLPVDCLVQQSNDLCEEFLLLFLRSLREDDEEKENRIPFVAHHLKRPEYYIPIKYTTTFPARQVFCFLFVPISKVGRNAIQSRDPTYPMASLTSAEIHASFVLWKKYPWACPNRPATSPFLVCRSIVFYYANSCIE